MLASQLLQMPVVGSAAGSVLKSSVLQACDVQSLQHATAFTEGGLSSDYTCPARNDVGSGCNLGVICHCCCDCLGQQYCRHDWESCSAQM